MHHDLRMVSVAPHHFGDNMAAISGVVKGGSSLPDSARLIHAIHRR